MPRRSIADTDLRTDKAPAAKGARFNARRSAFISAATEIMNRDGAQGMTLADVAGRLGMTTPSIRYYFRKKEDLAAACLIDALERVDGLLAVAAGQSSGEERVRRFITLYIELLGKIRMGHAAPLAIFCDVRAFTSQNSRPIIAGYDAMFERLRSFFLDEKRPWLDARSASARAFLLQSMVLWSPAWIEEYDIEDYGAIAGRISDIAINGLAGKSSRWKPIAIPASTLLGENHSENGNEIFLIAATKLLNEQGYRGASIDKIAAHLNMTKGSFYHYHDAKDDFVLQCFQRTYDIVASAQRAGMQLNKSSWTRLISVCASLTEFQLSDDGPLLLNVAISALPHALAKKTLHDWNRVSNRFAMIVSDGIIDGSIRTVDARIAAEMIHAAVNSTAQLTLWADVNEMDGVPRFYLEPLFFGIFSKPTA